MAIRIVTDSASDLPPPLAEAKGIAVVPVYVNLGGHSYRDGVEMSRAEFYRLLPDLAVPPKTSAPSPEDFRLVYQRLCDEGADHIISLHIPARSSATVQAASLAAAEVAPERVTVVDSGTCSLGLGLLATAAVDLVAAGASVAEVVARARAEAERTFIFAAAATAEYLRRSGRVSNFQATLAGLLDIKPVITLQGGVVTAQRVRTAGRALEKVLELVGQQQPWLRLSLVHADAAQRAEELRVRLLQLFPQAKVELVTEITPALGAQIGPGTVGAICTRA